MMSFLLSQTVSTTTTTTTTVSVVLVLMLTLGVIFPVPTTGKPEAGLISQTVSVSYSECIKQCDNTIECISSRYNRLFATCVILNIARQTQDRPGVVTYTRPFTADSSSTQECPNGHCPGSGQGGIDHCDNPDPVPATEVLGNMVAVGSKIKYQCLDGSDFSISECLQNGTWSKVNITCRCSMPTYLSNTPLQNIDFWTYQRKSDGTISARAICSSQCQNGTDGLAVCDSQTGRWTFKTRICCNNISMLIFLCFFL